MPVATRPGGRKRSHPGHVVACVLMVALSGCSSTPSGPAITPADEASRRFVGAWASPDYNEEETSTLTMTIRPAEGSVFHVTVHEVSPNECWDKPPGRRTMDHATTKTGTGRLQDPTTLVVNSFVLACDDGSDPEFSAIEEEAGISYTLVLDLATDRLYDNLGLVWNRGAPAVNWAGPSTEGDVVDGPAEAFSILHGGVTLRAPAPWIDHVEGFMNPRVFFLIGPGNEGRGETADFSIFVNPQPPETACHSNLRVPPPPGVPPSAAELVQAIRSIPDLRATVPVTESIGGVDALRMDVVAAPGAPIAPCAGTDVPIVQDSGRGWVAGVGLGGRGRVYVLDLPRGSARTLAILITAPDAPLFERAVEAAAPVVDSFGFHTPADGDDRRSARSP